MHSPALERSRIRTVRTALLRWFDRSKRDLPWRRTRDPYAIWVSEVMLQQTQVSTVIPYWHRFLERFPSVHSLAKAPLEQVLTLWRGLGYYHRARSLHRAAQEICEQHQGQLPRTAEQLRQLPGFGRYTAGAVASIAFAERTPLVDGNVARVFSRMFLVEGTPGERNRERHLWALAEQLVPEARPGDFNQALMELGALVCRSDSPECLLCPVRLQCGAAQAGRVDELPPPKQRKARKSMELAVAVWTRGEAVLMARRATQGLFGGLWELPSVELSSSSEPAGVLRALFHPSLTVAPRVALIRRTLTHRELSLHLYPVHGGRVPQSTDTYEEFRWVPTGQLSSLGISAAFQRALATALPVGDGRVVAG